MESEDYCDDEEFEVHYETGPDHAELAILPPYIVLMFFMTGVLLEMFWGFSLFIFSAQLVLGLIFSGLALIIFSLAVHYMTNAQTPISPDMPTVVIVENGPYNFSRNPIYLSMLLLYVGMVILFDIVWGMVLIIPLIYCIIKFSIEPEERYLERKFKSEYSAYSSRVRRWL